MRHGLVVQHWVYILAPGQQHSVGPLHRSGDPVIRAEIVDAVREGRRRDWLLSGLVLGLSLHTYQSARFLLLVVAPIVYLAAEWGAERVWKRRWRSVALLGVPLSLLLGFVAAHGPAELAALLSAWSFDFVLGSAHHRIGVAEFHGADAEKGRGAHLLAGLFQGQGSAGGRFQPGVALGEGLYQILSLGDVHERAFGESEGQTLGIQMGQLAGGHGADLGFRRQQDGADEPGEQAGRLDDTGVQGFHEDHRGAVLRGGDQLLAQVHRHACSGNRPARK